MKRFLSVVIPAAVVALAVGVAFAQMGPMGAGRMGGGMMGAGTGGGHMGPGMWGGGAGPTGCPGATATTAAQTPITEEKAKELAQEYADAHLKGFTVETVLPFTGMRGTMYSIELKGPNDDVRTFHVNPWGNVMPFGGPWRRAG